MAKGKFKKRASGTQFKPGNRMSPRCRKSPTYQQSSCDDPQPSASSSSATDIEATPLVKDRRRSARLQSNLQTDETHHGNRIIDLNILISKMNQVYSEHQTHAPKCKKLHLSLHKDYKAGLAVALQFTCLSCQFVSSRLNMFRARVNSSGAAINMLLASALLDLSIGINKANLLFASLDIPPPCKSHMQELLNQVSLKTQQLNEEDMTEKRQLVIQHQRDIGASNPYQMDVSVDGRYNTNRMVSSYKPGQGSSQAYTVAIENHTSYKYVIAIAQQNKLCWTGAYLLNRNFKVRCPGGHVGCTANIEYMKPHSERKMAHDIAQQLSKEDILVRNLTTDGDTQAHLGMQDFYDQLGNAWKVTRQADPNHLGSTQIRKVRNANWSLSMFPHKTTKSSRQQATAALAKDIRSRCTAIITKMRQQGDIKSQVKILPKIGDATVQCYGGNCSFCPQDSLVCSGLGGQGDWWYTSPYLQTHGIDRLKMTENDSALLKNILEIRLSEQAVLSVQHNTSTQKNETFNSGVLSVLPKQNNYCRNFSGKTASKILQLNNSYETSVQKRTKVFTGRLLSHRASKGLKYVSRQALSHKRYQRSIKYKMQRVNTRAKLEHMYHQARNDAQYKDEYVKGQLDAIGLPKLTC